MTPFLSKIQGDFDGLFGIFFGKDVANVSLSEAAVIAGSILYPGSPFINPKRALEFHREHRVREVEGQPLLEG